MEIHVIMYKSFAKGLNTEYSLNYEGLLHIVLLLLM